MISFDVNDFCRHIYQYGLVLDPSKVKIDGKGHNCRMIDNAPGKAAGSYTIYPNTGIAVFKSWRDGIVHKYFPGGTLPNIDFKKIMKEHRQKQLDEWFKVSQESYRKYSMIDTALSTSKYLESKNISANLAKFDIKIDRIGNLIVPFYNSKGYISTLQTIWPDGNKYFEEGGQISGCFNKIGFNLINSDYGETIYIGEGFATMATINEAFSSPCVVAGNCGNLLPVLNNLCRLYPNAKFVICADNDIALRETPVDSGQMIWSNPGIEAAMSCQVVHACGIVYPEFTNSDYNLTDFNDLHYTCGINEVIRQVTTQLRPTIKQTLEKLVYNLDEYNSNTFKTKLQSIKNYFEHFGQPLNGDLSSLFINELQLVTNIDDDYIITNIFFNFKLIFVEQIQAEQVTIKVDSHQLATFEQELEKIKLSHLIEIDQRFNAINLELQLTKQENALLKANLSKDNHG
jgi:phage/plasmid primase-like uncharacterized protein